MKVWKKNLVAAAVLVTVCAGIYVNWRYTEDQATANLTDTLSGHPFFQLPFAKKSPFAIRHKSSGRQSRPFLR